MNKVNIMTIKRRIKIRINRIKNNRMKISNNKKIRKIIKKVMHKNKKKRKLIISLKFKVRMNLNSMIKVG